MPDTVARADSVCSVGCPYSLPLPAEMTATDGRVAASKVGVVEEDEP